MTSSKDHSSAINRRQSQLASQQIPLPTSLEDCKQLIKANEKQLKAMEKEERETAKLRQAHQQQLIAQYEAKDDTKAAKIVRRIRNAEESKRTFKKVAAARGLTNKGGLDHILVPTDPEANPKTCTDWKRIEDPVEVNAYLTERNQRHFGQARGGKLTSPPFDTTMDFTAATQVADKILKGEYEPPEDLDNTTKWLLGQALRYATDPDVIEHTLTDEEFNGQLKAWKESTSTSAISGVHLGHAKAYFA